MVATHYVGQRLSYDGVVCTVRYAGQVTGTQGEWLGVEWDDPSRGKHDGSHKGVRYFQCLSKSPTAASFVRPTRRVEPPQSFLSALREKYAPESGSDGSGSARPDTIVYFGSKAAEQMGFDKIRKQQANLDELKFVILDGMRVAEHVAEGDESASVGEVCPKIVQLDLSRNLFQSLAPVVRICGELPVLQTLNIGGNRFLDVLEDEVLETGQESFQTVKDIALDDTLLSWNELCHIASKCTSASNLKANANQLASLPAVPYSGLFTNLTSIHLEFNDFTTLSDLASLASFKALRNIHLKGNNIKALANEVSSPPIFSSSLEYLDLSYNDIQEWDFVDGLQHSLPGLTALRLSHNPVYDKKDEDNKASSSEEAHMFTVARLGTLKSLNFSHITAADRTNAEMFYLSRIAKQLAGVPEAAEAAVLAKHPRYAELCETYGVPDVIRRDEVDPTFLEARLISVAFRYEQGTTGQKTRILKTRRIPKSFDVYAVKGIAGKMFGLEPLRVKLTWETGEWDPVAGYDDKEGDSSEEEAEEEDIHDEQDPVPEGDAEADGKPGRWIRREVELKEGPRQIGYCVDGLDVKIRVEAVP